MNEAVVVKHLSRSFASTLALRDVSFALPRKGLVGILGNSGCGKSTLLNVLAGLDDGFAGEVFVLGKNLKALSESKRRKLRITKIGYVFQDFRLLENETAERNVMLTLDAIYGDSMVDKRRKAHDILTFFGMEKKAKQNVVSMSGGEKQRVALSRALASDPPLVLADEPTGALDACRSEEVFALLRRCSKDRLVVVVSHDRPLAERYCDALILMNDGRVTDVLELDNGKKGSSPKSFLLHGARRNPRVSSGYLLSHAWHSIRLKPWRTLLSEAAIATGLTGLGLAAYLSGSISEELTNAFSSIIPPETIVMTPRSGGDSPVGAIYGAGFDECEYVLEEYGDMVLDYGTDLHMDYESWFVDRNDFTFQSGVETVRLKGFSMRSINEFLWLDELSSPLLYPRQPALLYVDQVVLGLPYESMFTTCLSLRITRTYQALGEYIDAHGLELVLHAANYTYGFDDEELFSVAAVTEAPHPCFYHLDHRWNRKILLNQMKFRSTLSEETPNPQYIFEIPFLSLRVPESEFLYFSRRDPKLAHLIYEGANDSYLPGVCSVAGFCPKRRLYLYGADKSGVSFPLLDECMETCPELSGRQIVSQGSYFAEAGSLAMGFMGKFFLCQDLSVAEEVVDSYSDLPLEGAFAPAQEIPGTRDGSVFAAGQGVRVSSYGKGEGAPRGTEECFLSSGLYEAWGQPKEIFVAAELGGEEVGSSYVRKFQISPLKVLGGKKASHDTFFVADDWTVDFYLEALGMSSFLLEPSGAVFYLAEGASAKEAVDRLSKSYGDYTFSNPAQDIADSLASTLNYVGTMLTLFSGVSLAMSALLFFIVMAVTVEENKKEIGLMSVLGISKNDIVRNYRSYCFLYAFSASASSVFMLGVSMIFAKLVIASRFGVSPQWGVPWTPFALVLGTSVIFTFLITLGISVNLHCKNTKKSCEVV